MLPCNSFNNPVNIRLSYSEFHCHRLLGGTIAALGSYFNYIPVSQLAIWVLLSVLSVHPIIFPFREKSFTHGVASVIKRGSEKQMRWINANFTVAMVAHEHAFWDFSMFQPPRYSMRCEKFVLLPHPTIPIVHYCPNPIPALIWISDSNVIPKPLNKCVGEFFPEGYIAVSNHWNDYANLSIAVNT